MTVSEDGNDEALNQILETADLAGALESEHFKQFLDHIPIAIAVSELKLALGAAECIVYVNMEFERLTGQAAEDIEGRSWDFLRGEASAEGDRRQLSEAIADEQDYIGAFVIENDDGARKVDAWSNVIEDESGEPVFRLIALADAERRGDAQSGELVQRLREQDLLLRELQHRVKNNLQMITALIRLEARNMPDDASQKGFDRLAGRVQALALLYRFLSPDDQEQSVDLGVYLSEIASAVMHAHAVEGIHLDLQVDLAGLDQRGDADGPARQRVADQRSEICVRWPRWRNHHLAQPCRCSRVPSDGVGQWCRPAARRPVAGARQAQCDDRAITSRKRQGARRGGAGLRQRHDGDDLFRARRRELIVGRLPTGGVAPGLLFDPLHETLVMPQGDGEIVGRCLQPPPQELLCALVVTGV
jgi:PAS domain S-box-containing protein